MKTDIYDQTRKHLISILKKILHGNYTQSEIENFIITGYQDEVFERIRIKVVEIVSVNKLKSDSRTRALSEENIDAIKEIVSELERQAT